MIFERIVIGEIHEFGSHRFVTDDIKRFAQTYDPQYFHLDEARARQGPFGALCASGWHTTAAMTARMVRYFQREAERAAARGEPAAPLGPPAGFEALRWLKPVYPGDAITFAGRVVGKEESGARPGWGIVSIEATGTNQRGEPVFTTTLRMLVRRQSP